MGLSSSKHKDNNLKDIETKPEPEPEPEPEPDSQPDSEVCEEFKNLDKDNDDLITWEEFEIEFEQKHGRKMDRNDLWAFLAMDNDGDANVSLKEWRAYHSRETYD